MKVGKLDLKDKTLGIIEIGSCRRRRPVAGLVGIEGGVVS
jgi:hypothetical protein